MHVVTVVFDVLADEVEAFQVAVSAQAANSLALEPDCLVFDVAVDPADPARIFLYEIYRDRAAFQAHLESTHFKDFDAKVLPWVRNKEVAQWSLLSRGEAKV